MKLNITHLFVALGTVALLSLTAAQYRVAPPVAAAPLGPTVGPTLTVTAEMAQDASMPLTEDEYRFYEDMRTTVILGNPYQTDLGYPANGMDTLEVYLGWQLDHYREVRATYNPN